MSSFQKPLCQSKSKFNMEPQGLGGVKVCSPHLGHMTKMAAMPIYGRNPLKIFFSGTKGQMALGFGMQPGDRG